MPNEPVIQIKEEEESEEQPESDDTDLNREKKRWEPTTKYSKYMASYFRKQMDKPVEEMETGNIVKIDYSKAELVPD